jgi:hypothetical protein
MSTIIKSLTAASMIFGLAACASAPPSISQYSYTRYVVERDLIVRQSANAGADEVGRLSAGAVLTAWVEDVGGNWFRLHSDNGNVGYIFSRPFRIAD